MIAKTAQEPEDRLLLARIWDKYEQMERRSIPTATVFLSPRERVMAQSLLHAAGIRSGCLFDGGYPDAERTRLLFLPDWAGEDHDELVFLRAAFHGVDSALTHRDILGSLMALGVTRERVGDILVSPHSADLVAAPSLRDFFLREWTSAGRVKLTVTEISRGELLVPAAQAFSMSRGRAAELIAAGRVSLDHTPCLKPDKPVGVGCTVSVRGMGKARLAEIGGLTKKGRTGIVIERFI